MDKLVIAQLICSGCSVLLILIAIILVYKLVKKHNLEPKIIELITIAEAKFGSGEGKVKFEYVFDELYNKFAPKIIKILFTPEEIRNFIQYVFDKVKIALDYQASISEGENNGE